jgi:RND family efflux transporter MFP subunit
MKYFFRIMKKIIVFINFMLVFGLIPLFAQDEHGHTHADPGTHKSPEQAEAFVVYAQSQKYELTLRYGELQSGQETELTLYIADYATNRPLEGIEVKVSVQDDPALTFTQEMHEPGVYHIIGSFPEKKSYALAVSLNSQSHGADLFLLQPIEIGKKLPQPADAEIAQTRNGPFQWLIYLLIFLGGLALGALILRRRPKVAAVLIIAISIPAVFQQASAHEGHDDDEPGTAGNTVYIPKETQFLFNLLTQKIDAGNFQPSIEFYGTVIPAPSGFSNVVSPQNARVSSIKVSPGQNVQQGQTIAVLKPTSTQSEQVGIAVETGRIQAEIRAAEAELVAAEKELDRLKAIEDIVAKKDVQAAEARVNAAEQNLRALRNIPGSSSTSGSGDIVLKSPISGTVGQFTLTSGTEVIGGMTLFTVTNLSSVFIEAQVYDRDAVIVNRAEKYTVTCNDADHKTADVRMVSPALEVNPTNQSQKVYFELQNPEGEFKIGEFVTLHAFQQATTNSIFIPNSSISEINGKPVVFVKENPELYAVRYIAPGNDNGTHTMIMKGLNEGDRYVTSSTYQVKMMMLNQ